MSIKINTLELENVKRIKAVRLEPTQNGLTIVGGRNGQGKTSVLDAIAWALGGNKKKPSQANREESVNNPYLKIILNNGLIVERKGKNSDLTVTDPDGQKYGQKLLDSFVEELAIDLPKFMESSNKEKADTLLQIIGVGDQLNLLEKKERDLYNERHALGQNVTRKQKYAEELIRHDEAPDELISVSELIQQQQAILAQNGENQRKRERASQLQYQATQQAEQIQQLKTQLEALESSYQETLADLDIAQKSTQDLVDQSTEELEVNIQNIELINNKVRDNQSKAQAEQEYRDMKNEYDVMTDKIDEVRQEKMELLNSKELPLPELSVEDGELVYKGQKWDNMSGSEQLRVSTAIVRKLKPECGFVLIDKLEQMDLETLNEFGDWLEQEGLQAIAARVTTGEEATIIIEDGEVVSEQPAQTQPTEGWDFNV